MDKLEQRLRDPESYGAMPSEEQIHVWSAAALKRWAIENQSLKQAPEPIGERVKEVLYWMGMAACVAFLAGLMVGSHATLIAVMVCAAALAITEPVREFLLEQLG